MESYDKEKLIPWFCGFYEGEGWVSNDIGNNNRIRLGIAQNDRTPLDIALQLWGGSIKKRIRKSPASSKICIGYEWVLPHAKSLEFIKDIEPHMIIPYKKEQIKNILHKFNHSPPLRYNCSECNTDYASPSGRRRHYKQCHLNTI